MEESQIHIINFEYAITAICMNTDQINLARFGIHSNRFNTISKLFVYIRKL